ncbi:MAG: hypothetical protein ACRDRK_09200 [Pseudonocardia sp.]
MRRSFLAGMHDAAVLTEFTGTQAGVEVASTSWGYPSRPRQAGPAGVGLGRLVRTTGAVGVEELAVATGWSRRHLLTRFRAQIGLAPKTAARVLRFQHAAGLLVPADHSHLVRDFRSLAGCTPSQLVAEWWQA